MTLLLDRSVRGSLTMLVTHDLHPLGAFVARHKKPRNYILYYRGFKIYF